MTTGVAIGEAARQAFVKEQGFLRQFDAERHPANREAAMGSHTTVYRALGSTGSSASAAQTGKQTATDVQKSRIMDSGGRRSLGLQSMGDAVLLMCYC